MKLHGIIPPLITPLSGRETLDREGLHRLLEHIIAGQVAWCIRFRELEGPCLSYQLRKR